MDVLGSISLLAGIVFLVIALISHTITEEAFKIGCLLLIGIVGILIGISLKKKRDNFLHALPAYHLSAALRVPRERSFVRFSKRKAA